MAELKKDGIRAAISEKTERETLKKMAQRAEDPNDSQQGWGHVPERESVQRTDINTVKKRADQFLETSLGAQLMKEVTRYDDGNGCTRRQLVDNILILIDQSSRVSDPIVAPEVGHEAEFDAWWDEYQRPWLPNGVGGYEHAKAAWITARAPAPIVAPEVDESWFDLALRYLRGDPALTAVPYSDDSVFADFLRFWDAQTPHFRSVIGSVFRAAPKFTAPAATVAPQQSVAARCPDCGARLTSDFDEDVGMWEECTECEYRNALSSRPAPASPVALRDEAVCKCGLDKDDPIHSFSTERQQMHSFTPRDATTPPSTRAKAADWFPIENAPKDEPVWLFGPSLIDEDYNTKGVVEGYWLDDLGWMGAVWNNEQDYWESKQVNPTHWMPIPQPPTEIKG